MGRGLSAAVKNYNGPFWWAVKLTLRDATVKYYAQDALTFAGVTYEPYLKSVSSFEMTRGLRVSAAELEFSNADLTIGKLLETKAFEGALSELKQLLLGIEAELLLATGLLSEEAQNDLTATFRMISELDPAGIRAQERNYTIACSWRFKSEQCGYVGELTTCDKDFVSCTTRAQTHRFDAFPTLTPEVERAVARTPGAARHEPGEGSGERRRSRVRW